jgi:hypothetical protein
MNAGVIRRDAVEPAGERACDYVALLAASEDRRRGSDDGLLRRMMQLRDVQAPPLDMGAQFELRQDA